MVDFLQDRQRVVPDRHGDLRRVAGGERSRRMEVSNGRSKRRGEAPDEHGLSVSSTKNRSAATPIASTNSSTTINSVVVLVHDRHRASGLQIRLHQADLRRLIAARVIAPVSGSAGVVADRALT